VEANVATMPAPPFQALIDEHRRVVFAFLRSLVGQAAAEDCLQETFLAALRAYPPREASNLRGWIFRIARNKALDHHRARSAAPDPVGGAGQLDGVAAESAPTWLGGAAARGGMGERDGAIWSAVAQLPEAQRAAVLLRFAVDLRYREIAAALEISEEAARRRVSDALRTLRAQVPAGKEE
jgi:DNA-directed RNA polymerase specialized sigma24 family protein